MDQYERNDIKHDLQRVIIKYGFTKTQSVWTEVIEDIRCMLREYDATSVIANQTITKLDEPELVYQREKEKKPRKPRQTKKKDVLLNQSEQ